MTTWLSKTLVGLYRLYVGDVQVTKLYTGFDSNNTVFLGKGISKKSRKMHIDVKQLKFIKIYSRWWLREKSTYGYEIKYIVFDDLNVIDSGTAHYPQLCSNVFANTYRPHLLAVDCFLREYIGR